MAVQYRSQEHKGGTARDVMHAARSAPTSSSWSRWPLRCVLHLATHDELHGRVQPRKNQWRSLFSSSRDRGTEKIYLSRRCKCCPPPPQGQGEGRCLCGSSAVRSEDCCVQPAQECQEVLLGDD
ncbi:uncharacterized protein [Aegilops tauschii subsp. strangulata]|uniref:uncharacterized protein isoform X1 n=1 Tax=Aegilops tauschii subsp. strangulata TaxID=200361 RepID=UPI003CC8A8B4